MTGERSDVATRTLEELQTSFKKHAPSILTDEIGKRHTDDVEVVGCERMTNVLEESIADLQKNAVRKTEGKILQCAHRVARRRQRSEFHG